VPSIWLIITAAAVDVAAALNHGRDGISPREAQTMEVSVARDSRMERLRPAFELPAYQALVRDAAMVRDAGR
jgi:hypothetical protein